MVARRRGLARVEPEQLLVGLGAALVVGALAMAGFALAPSEGTALACLVLTAVVLSPITPLLWMGPLAIVGVPRSDIGRARRELALVLAAGCAGLLTAWGAERAGGPSAALLLLAVVPLVPAALSLRAARQLGSTVSSERRSSTGVGVSALASDSSSIASA
jgi:hypothetical protein